MISTELFTQIWNAAHREGLCPADLAKRLGWTRQRLNGRVQYLRSKGVVLPNLPSGHRAGGLIGAAKLKQKYGATYFAIIGKKGGKAGHTGGFYANRELARECGRKGGTISRRTKKKV